MARFGTVAVIGVGLIGGSIGKALRVRELAERVVGIGRNPSRLEQAVRLGVIDDRAESLEQGVAEAEIVVVCAPVTEIAANVLRAAAAGNAGVLVTDAGSTKGTIVEAVELDSRARATFVAAHPIAGSERQGASFADADLFDGRTCALTPTERTPVDRLERARTFWSSLGCRLIELDPKTHDELLALTSHLPHAAAAALAATVPVEALRLAAGAYRDGTRVAAADAALWAAIFRENRDAVLRALDRYQTELDAFRRALQDDDPEGLRAWWDTARSRRDQFDPGSRSHPRALPH